jgi:hypothetical protein
MSTPGHHNEIVLVGDVHEVYTDGDGAAIGVILMVDADEPCEVPVMFPAARTGVSVGDRLWVRGRLTFEPLPNRRGSLHFVQARWIDPVKRQRGGSGRGDVCQA